jgi:hypothetical protein
VTPSGTTISALVTDTSGVGALTGGTLADKAFGTNYGAFSTPGGQGTFEYAMTWSALYQKHAISFPAGGTEARVVTATFYDTQSRTASQDLTLTLACSAATDSPCSDGCHDLSTDATNCGTCGTVCANTTVCKKGGGVCACHAGHCFSFENPAVVGGGSCNATCQMVGGTCAANTCSGVPTGAVGPSNNSISCGASGPYACCCQQ